VSVRAISREPLDAQRADFACRFGHPIAQHSQIFSLLPLIFSVIFIKSLKNLKKYFSKFDQKVAKSCETSRKHSFGEIWSKKFSSPLIVQEEYLKIFVFPKFKQKVSKCHETSRKHTSGEFWSPVAIFLAYGLLKGLSGALSLLDIALTGLEC